MSASTRTGGPCPKCHGAGKIDEFGIGLLVVCNMCAGALTERRTDDPEHQDHAVWRHPAVSNLETCHVCLGTGVVVNLGGTGEPTGHVIEMPCPACSAPESGDEPERL
jgi:DnaJ-class molecular chaperone